MPVIRPEQLNDWVGRETGVTDWMEMSQDRINAFANATDDWQPIHVDPEQAKMSFFGGTVAHGFLTLSLLSKFAYEAALSLEGAVVAINYGFNQVRFLSPVPAGARVRCRLGLKSWRIKPPARVQLTYEATVEIESAEKPALIAEWLTMQELGRALPPDVTKDLASDDMRDRH